MDTGIPYAIIRATLDLGAWTVCSIVWPGRCGVSPSSAAATTGFSPSSPKTWRPRLWRAGSGRDSFVADAAGPETFTFKELVPLLASAVGGPSGWCIRLRSWA